MPCQLGLSFSRRRGEWRLEDTQKLLPHHPCQACEDSQFTWPSSYFRILEKDESNIDACQILAVHELAREGNVTTVSSFKTQKSSPETNVAKEEPLKAPVSPRLWRRYLELSSLRPLRPTPCQVGSGSDFVQCRARGRQ